MGQKLLAPVEGRVIRSSAVGSPVLGNPVTRSPVTRSPVTGNTGASALGGEVLGGLAGAVLAQDCTLPLAAPLADLFPEGGLRRGTTVLVGSSSPRLSSSGAPGATSLALALLSGPCTGGSWCAVVGAPDLGLVAAAQLGITLERLAVVPSPGPSWPAVTAALLEGFDLVLLRTAGRVSFSDARKLEARARERRSVLAVMGDGWPGTADVRLNVVTGRWSGLEDGCGHLWGREIEVVAGGRGAASRERRARILFGGPPLGPAASELEPVRGSPGLIAVVPSGEVAAGMDIAG
jgi:hypothetical protein